MSFSFVYLHRVKRDKDEIKRNVNLLIQIFVYGLNGGFIQH